MYLTENLLIFIIFSPCLSYGLYFHMRETETRCFIEDAPADILISGSYKIAILEGKKFVALPHLGVHVTVSDPKDKIMLSRLYAAEGRFTFITHSPGDHRICLSSNTSAWFGGGVLRIHLNLNIGDNALDYKEIASKEKLNDVQLRLRKLTEQVSMLLKDQNFQRLREVEFRRLSENIYSRVTWWSLAQILLLIIIGFVQMRHLRSFFMAKKLV